MYGVEGAAVVGLLDTEEECVHAITSWGGGVGRLMIFEEIIAEVLSMGALERQSGQRGA